MDDLLSDPPLTDTEIAGLLALRYAPDEVPSEDRRAVAESILDTIAPFSSPDKLTRLCPGRYSDPPPAPAGAWLTLGDRTIQVARGPHAGIVCEPMHQAIANRARLGFAFFHSADHVIEQEEGYSRAVDTNTMPNGHEVLGPLLYLWKEAAHEIETEATIQIGGPDRDRESQPGNLPGLRRKAA